jgi:hypothetical protein
MESDFGFDAIDDRSSDACQSAAGVREMFP